MRAMPSNSVDSIVTDPPYGLSFMGKRWDYDVPSVEIWAECLRVLKPGGHLLAFAGTRTQHRMAVRIEDAGFEIRDMIAWVYGSGFPKSLDVSKAIDKAAGAEREVIGDKMRPDGKTVLSARSAIDPAGEGWDRPWRHDPARTEAQGKLTAPATDAARQWEGWGTALKPALEPITMARKPLIGTVAANVLAHGTGALNIDGCRVETTDDCARKPALVDDTAAGFGKGLKMGGCGHDEGRWPANLILSYNEDEFELRSNVTSEQRKQLLLWMYENT
jgi:site-specific DNA-methyltransferase (adenine-specific)